MSNHITRLASVALAAVLATSVAAQAQTRQPARVKVAKARTVLLAEIKAPPLTVIKPRERSFLDPGPAASPYSGNGTPEYIASNTFEHRPIYVGFSPSRFGEETLPGRFDVPYNPRYFPERNVDFSPF